MNQIFNFQIEKQDKNFITAVSAKAPGILFGFEYFYYNPYSGFEISDISAPASIILPEYVNMPIEQIPIYFPDEEYSIPICMEDQFGRYQIFRDFLSFSDVLSANDEVYMKKA